MAAAKAVFAAEYTDADMNTEEVCHQANAMDFSVVLKRRDLGAYREACRPRAEEKPPPSSPTGDSPG